MPICKSSVSSQKRRARSSAHISVSKSRFFRHTATREDSGALALHSKHGLETADYGSAILRKHTEALTVSEMENDANTMSHSLPAKRQSAPSRPFLVCNGLEKTALALRLTRNIKIVLIVNAEDENDSLQDADIELTVIGHGLPLTERPTSSPAFFPTPERHVGVGDGGTLGESAELEPWRVVAHRAISRRPS